MSGAEANKGDVASPEKKQERSSLIELKNGKVSFKQKPISFEKQSETLQEIVKFREMLDMRVKKQEGPLTEIPDEHRPLIAKLAHESDKTLAFLSKNIRQELMPIQGEDDENENNIAQAASVLPLPVVEAAVKSILIRNNYGLDAPNGKPPAAVCVWRWEVKVQYREWLPKNAREKAEARLAERVMAKQELKAVFELLPQEERNAVLDPKTANKNPVKELKKSNIDKGQEIVDLTGDYEKISQLDIATKKDEAENDSQAEDTSKKANRLKKTQDLEKAAKEQERLEKKAAKAEKEKKQQDAQSKSRSLMANFFGKRKCAISRDAESSIAGPSKVQSEFEKMFKPFVLKKDTTLAPSNWFLEANRRRHSIAEEKSKDMETPPGDIVNMSSHERLQSILQSIASPSLSPQPICGFRQHSLTYKLYNPITVRDIASQISEAEISGDIPAVRHLVNKLGDRRLFPAKALIFKEDARPGYFGTWTRNSRAIGPRTPFAKDMLVVDYSYDSGEEWEEEAPGDADDVVEDGEDEDADDGQDSDMDSWLVDDDDEPEMISEDLEMSIELPMHQPMKRKGEGEERKLGKKRKVVIPLVPFAKGPCLESRIGKCEYDPFKPYRIQLFNDTPFPIDPFNFVSTCIEDKRTSDKLFAKTTATEFVVPLLPEHVCAPNADSPPSTTRSSPATSAPKKAALAPKVPFPDVHLPLLLNKINEIQATSIVLLVELLYQEFKVHNIKKVAIEAKVKEVSQKCREKKYWIIKPSAKVYT